MYIKMYILLTCIVFRMASGSGSRGNQNDNPDYVISGNEGPIPTPLIPNSDARFVAILEQLAKSHEAQLNMQTQIAALLQV